MASKLFGKASTPAVDPPILGDPSDDDSKPELNLTPDQLASAGLGDLEEGDKFTVTITGTVTSNDPDTGLEAEITEASEGEKSTDEPGGDMEPLPGKKAILSPKDAGMGSYE